MLRALPSGCRNARYESGMRRVAHGARVAVARARSTLPLDDGRQAELLAQAAELGYAPSAYRLGECYEYGKMGCPIDSALSIHYYVSALLG